MPETEGASRGLFEWHRLGLGATLLALIMGVTAMAVLLLRSGSTVPVARIDPARVLFAQPDDGAANVPLNAPVVVQAPGARLWAVVVADPAGRQVPGTISPDGHGWQSGALLAPDTRYRVSMAATVGLEREIVTRTTWFTTLRPTAMLRPTILPSDGQTVGVGMPIVLRFNVPVSNRAAVVAALTVT